VSIGTAKRRRIYERDGYTCQLCRKAFEVPTPPRTSPRDAAYQDRRGILRICLLEVDHIKPRFHGGGNDDSNLQALCTQCNVRKGHRI
jgi:5-methylcytosine-specific restriction endonuclease McrA